MITIVNIGTIWKSSQVYVSYCKHSHIKKVFWKLTIMDIFGDTRLWARCWAKAWHLRGHETLGTVLGKGMGIIEDWSSGQSRGFIPCWSRSREAQKTQGQARTGICLTNGVLISWNRLNWVVFAWHIFGGSSSQRYFRECLSCLNVWLNFSGFLKHVLFFLKKYFWNTVLIHVFWTRAKSDGTERGKSSTTQKNEGKDNHHVTSIHLADLNFS